MRGEAKVITLDQEQQSIVIQATDSYQRLIFSSYELEKAQQSIKSKDSIECIYDTDQPTHLIIQHVYSANEIHQQYNQKILKTLGLLVGSAITVYITLLITFSNFNILGSGSSNSNFLFTVGLIISAVAFLVFITSLISLLITLIIKIFNAFKK